MPSPGLDDQITGIAALEEPARRALYLYVAAQPTEVSRDQAAAAVGLSRGLVGFHLDRLVEEGLLDASFRRLSGRSGPGAGRPAKLYRRSARQLDLTLPPRRYELAARILADAVDSAGAVAGRDAVATAARATGERMGRELAAQLAAQERTAASEPATAPAGGGDSLPRLTSALVRGGYEPETGDGELRLRNCPFHALIGEHRALVCGMNLALAEGLVAGLGTPDVVPTLDPRDGYCCVRLTLGRPPGGLGRG